MGAPRDPCACSTHQVLLGQLVDCVPQADVVVRDGEVVVVGNLKPGARSRGTRETALTLGWRTVIVVAPQR